MRIHVYSLFASLEEGTKQLHGVVEAEPMETGWMCKSGTYTVSLYRKDIHCSYIDSGYKATLAVEYEDDEAYTKLRKALYAHVLQDLEEYNKCMLKCLDSLK